MKTHESEKLNFEFGVLDGVGCAEGENSNSAHPDGKSCNLKKCVIFDGVNCIANSRSISAIDPHCLTCENIDELDRKLIEHEYAGGRGARR